jgi:hypothetical protein
MGQGPAEDEEDFEVDICKLKFELSRLEDVQVVLPRLVHVRPLSEVGFSAADM